MKEFEPIFSLITEIQLERISGPRVFRNRKIRHHTRQDPGFLQFISHDSQDALASGDPLPAPLEELWDGLEAFAAYGDEVEPATLAAAARASLGVPPDAAGVADHEGIGDEWERSGRRTSIVEAVFDQLGAAPPK